MIQLHSFGANFGLIDPSPFVLKVDAYLRMAGVEYSLVARRDNLKNAPKGKLPFIRVNDQIIADSQMIIEYIKTLPDGDLDTDLSKEQQAQVYLITKSLDENLYFCLVYSRWLCEDTWPLLKRTFFGKLPWLLRWFVPALVRKKVASSVKGQGLGRHSRQEILNICHQSFSALSVLLGNKNYFFGDKPSSLDAACFAFLAEFILVDFSNEFNQAARGYPTLVSYCRRIKQVYYDSK